MEQLNPSSSRWSGLQVRAASALALAAVVGLVLYLGGWIFTAFIIFAALIMMREWNALVAEDNAAERMAGMFYVAIPCASIIWLRDMPSGFALTLYVMATICATDVGAFFAGRQIGGPKLAPSISPNKTWAGLGGGVASAAIVGGVAQAFVPFPESFFGAIVLGAVMAVVAQAGDLLESWMKRRAGVKDSGTLLPGHGGLLDRVDGYIFTLPLFALMLWLSSAQ